MSVAELGASSVNLAVRPWVKSAKYAPASHEITERIKKGLDAITGGIKGMLGAW